MTDSFTRLCRTLSVVSRVLVILSLVGLGALAVLFAVSALPELWATNYLDGEAATALRPWQKLGLWVVAAVAIAPMIAMFAIMARLFTGFAQGHVFTGESATSIRQIGGLLIVGAVLGVCVGAIRSILVTITNPEGQRSLAISFGSEEIILIVLGGLLLVIGQAMAEAARIDAENRSFI